MQLPGFVMLMHLVSMLVSCACFEDVALGCSIAGTVEDPDRQGACAAGPNVDDSDDSAAMQVRREKAKPLAALESSSDLAANVSVSCDPIKAPQTDSDFVSKFRPCGTYSSCSLPVADISYGKRDYPERTTIESNNFIIAANVVHPGRTLVRNQNYIVQFDIGLTKNRDASSVDSSTRISSTNWPFSVCPNGPDGGECCLEAIMNGDDDWGDLGIGANYDCMGQCGPGSLAAGWLSGCDVDRTRTAVVGGLDCAKHDLCSVYKSVLIGSAAGGFCADPDCGDEAAQTVFNCWSGFSFGNPGGIGTGNRICRSDTHGEFNTIGSQGGGGNCPGWQGYSMGQGLITRTP